MLHCQQLQRAALSGGFSFAGKLPQRSGLIRVFWGDQSNGANAERLTKSCADGSMPTSAVNHISAGENYAWERT
jgi:hypothetical protein